MSKLLDKIYKASQPTPRRMGFAIHRDEEKVPSMVLVLRLEDNGGRLLKKAHQEADATILSVTQLPLKKDLRKDVEKLPESYPWGVQAEAIQPKEIETLRKAGCDYLVFGIEGTPAPVLNEESIGKVLLIDTSLDETLMRVLDEVPTDAIFIDSDPEDSLTIKGLMFYRSMVSYVSKPVLIRVPLSLSEEELKALGNAGIAGIVLEPRNAGDIKQVTRLRKVIESLPPREAEEEPRVETLVPQSAIGEIEPLPDEDE